VNDDLVAAGRLLRLETAGARVGDASRRHATLGFVRDADGSLLVAAGSPDARWAADLDADPRCRVTLGDENGAYEATLLEGPERARAIRELILRGGTPAERLGLGPAYRLRPVTDG
jgi:deazaflavin-dependent oxidoreductase (nitroreductase family)